MVKKIFKRILKPVIIIFTKICSIKYEPKLFLISIPTRVFSFLMIWKTRLSKFYLRSIPRDIDPKAAKRINLFLISLTISLIYIILSLKGADAGNNVFLIIGLLGFFSLFTTPILLFSFFINSRYEPPNIVKSILPETKSSKVNTTPSNRGEANKASSNYQSDQMTNDRKKNRGTRRKSARTKKRYE